MFFDEILILKSSIYYEHISFQKITDFLYHQISLQMKKIIMNITTFIQLLAYDTCTTFLKKLRSSKVQRIYTSKSNSLIIFIFVGALTKKKRLKILMGQNFVKTFDVLASQSFEM